MQQIPCSKGVSMHNIAAMLLWQHHATIGPIIEKHDVIHKTGSTQHIATLPTLNHDNVARKFKEVWTCGFSDMDTYTDTHITIHCAPLPGKSNKLLN